MNPLSRLKSFLWEHHFSDREVVGGLVLLVAVPVFWRLGRTTLIDWDESIYAAVAKEMVKGWDWLTLHWNRETFFEKPPLYFWLTAGAYWLFGISEFTARLWSALFGVLGVVLTYYFGRRLFDRPTGIIAALALGTTIHWVFQSRNGTLDIPVAVLTLTALYFFWRAWEGRRVVDWFLFGFLVGLALMTKGPVAVIPIVVAFLFSLVSLLSGGHSGGYGRLLGSIFLAAVTFLIVVVPWHLAMYLKHGEPFITEYFLYHMLARARLGIEAHAQPFLWYTVVLKHWGRLWLAVFLVGLPFLFWQVVGGIKAVERRALFLLLIWVGITFVIFSSSASKIQWYIVPIYPPLALVIGYELRTLVTTALNFFRRRGPNFRGDLVWRLVYLVVLVFGIYGLADRRAQWYLTDYNRPLAEAALTMAEVSRKNDVLLVSNAAPGVPIFYGDRTVKTATARIVEAAVRGQHRFFVLSPEYILEEMENSYPEAGLTVFYRQGSYALFGRE